MATVVSSGTVSAPGGGSGQVEITPPVSAPGIYQLYLDLGSMDSPEELQILLGTSINGTPTYNDTVVKTFTGAQDLAAKALPPLLTIQGIDLRYNQLNGAAFSFGWRLDRLGTPQFVNGGRQLTVIGSNHTLATVNGVATSPYVLVPSFDFASAGPADLFEITVYFKPISSSSVSGAIVEQVSGAALYPPGGQARITSIVQLPPIVVPYQAIFSLKQVAGTPQNVDWLVVTI